MKVDIFNTDNKYSIIYADPPWQYKVWSRDTGLGRSADSHYKTMTKADIENLPIPSIAEKDAVLFLWVTYPCLEQGLELIKKWGFTYKTCGFSWVKLNKKSKTPFVGMGYYTRANNEICLLATKGKPLKRISRAVQQLVVTPIEEHSKKPSVIRERIVNLFGDLPRIEIFARQHANGWDCWGNEAPDDPIEQPTFFTE